MLSSGAFKLQAFEGGWAPFVKDFRLVPLGGAVVGEKGLFCEARAHLF